MRCINFGIGESLPSLFLCMVNLYLIIFESWSILNKCVFNYCFLDMAVNLDVEAKSLVNLHSPNFIFAALNPYQIVLEKK